MSLSDSFLLLFAGLAALALVAGVGTRLAVALLRRRRSRAEAAGRRTRDWGGRDRERMRSKYFQKEHRARAVRARHRHLHTAEAPPPEAEAAAPTPPERLHRATLGLSGALTPEAVRLAYKARVREYHPDQVARLGVKLRVLAEEETKRINEAYAYFRKHVGF